MILPGWSIMPPVELFGLGTAEVESAEHYVSRISWITGCMVKKLLVTAAPKDLRHCVENGSVFTILCAPSENAWRLICGLEELTGTHSIHCGTFSNLRHVLAKTALGRSGSQRRWCPSCYACWDDDLSYEPLRWRIASVTTCAIHGVRLESACRHCGHAQYKVSYETRRICGYCSKPLGHVHGSTEINGYERWVQEKIDDLIGLCADPDQGEVPLCAYSAFCTAALKIHGSSSRDVSLTGHWATRIYLNNVLTGKPTSISHLIDSCSLQHVTPRDILLRPLEAAAEPLQLNMDEHHFVGVPGERFEEAIRKFENLTTILRSSRATAYLPKPKWLFRYCKIGRNTIVEHSPQAYYDYISERESRFGLAERTHINRAFILMASRASALRTTHSAAVRVKMVDRIAMDAGVSFEQAMAALLGADAWIDAVRRTQRTRRVATVKLKKALAMTIIDSFVSSQSD